MHLKNLTFTYTYVITFYYSLQEMRLGRQLWYITLV